MKFLISNRIRNFIILLITQFLLKVASFFVTIFLTRRLSVEAYGVYIFVNNIISYLMLFINFGYDIYFSNKLLSGEILENEAVSIQIKSRSIFSVFFIMVSYVVILIKVYEVKPIFKILYLILVFKVFMFSFDIGWLYRIKNEFGKISRLEILSNYVRLFLIFFLVKNDSFVAFLALVDLFVDTIFKFFMIKPYIRKINYKLFHLEKVKKIIKNSVIINASYFMITVYYKLDSLMLGIFKDDHDVAIYNAAYNIMLLAIIPTGLLFQIFLPDLISSKGSKKILYKYIISTMLLSLIIFIPTFSFSKGIILILYGKKYFESINILKYLSFNLISCYAAGAFANPINAWGYNKDYLFIVTIGALANFIGNIILIPSFGIKAAIVTTIMSEVIVFMLALFWYIRNFINVKEI